MTLFHHKISFRPVDPLANGLYDEIEAEKHEAESLTLSELEQVDVELPSKWDSILQSARKDPEFVFVNDDE